MRINEPAVSWAVSAAVVMTLAPFAVRSRRQCGIFSVSVGIIMYTIAKSIIVECGWGFAAVSGVVPGVLFEATVMCCGIILLREMKAVIASEKSNAVVNSAAVIMVCAGKNILFDYMLIPDRKVFLLGHALQMASLTTAVYYVSNEPCERKVSSLAAFGGISAFAGWAAVIILRNSGISGNPIAAPMMIMLGVCVLVSRLAVRMKDSGEISAAGFAAGLMMSYSFDCMTG